MIHTPPFDHRDESPLVRAALDYAAAELDGDATGHDIHHVHRVYRMAVRLAEAEGAHVETVQLIAALHDIKDFKFTGDAMSGANEAKRWLLEQGTDPALAEHVARDIAGISFKGAGTPPTPLTLEGRCVQDADRLDAIGAIGIARCFAYGGHVGRPIHDPHVPVFLAASTAAYLDHKGTSTNHFPEKLFGLAARLNTATARAIAEERDAFLHTFYDRFIAEWDGTDPALALPR